MKGIIHCVLAFFLALSFFASPAAFGQGGATGAISGTVVDVNGGTVADADVQIISSATSVLVRHVNTTADGSFVATLLPTFFAAAQYESFYAALIVFVGLNLLQFVIGSYIEPRAAGTAVSVSPFMVLFAVFFWGMLWGIAGAFIDRKSVV